jgi:predicted DNA-binding protein with PD1-like motif
MASPGAPLLKRIPGGRQPIQNPAAHPDWGCGGRQRGQAWHGYPRKRQDRRLSRTRTSSPTSFSAIRAMRRSPRLSSSRALRASEASQVTAIGGFERATVGWFDHMAKDSRLNVHVVLWLSDGTTRGRRLIEGRLFPTLEVVVTENPAELRKVMHPSSGSRSSISIGQATRMTSCSRGVASPAAGNPCGGDRADQGQERSCLRSE